MWTILRGWRRESAAAAQVLLRTIGKHLHDETGETSFVAGLSEGRFALLTASGNDSAAAWSDSLFVTAGRNGIPGRGPGPTR